MITSSHNCPHDNIALMPLMKRQRTEEKKLPPTLSLEHSQIIIDKIFSSKPTADKSVQSALFHMRINGLIEEGKKCIRLHKKENDIPLWYNKREKSLDLTLIGRLLSDEGAFKRVKKAIKICISEEQLNFKCVVIKRVQQGDIPAVVRGLKIHRELFSLIEDARLFFVPPPLIYPLYDTVKGKKMELEEPYFPGDLSFFVKNEPFIIRGKQRFLKPIEIVKGLQNVVSGINKLALISHAHLDIKPDNVLVRIDGAQVNFLISDFETIVRTSPAHTEERMSYHINYAARQGVSSQETDRYSLALLIAETLILNFVNFAIPIEDNEERDFFESFLNAYRNLTSQDTEVSKKKRQEFRTFQINALKDMLSESDYSLCSSFENIDHTPSLSDVIALLRLADALGNEDQYGAYNIRKFAIGVLFEENIFQLLGTFLAADLAIEESLDHADDSSCSSYHDEQIRDSASSEPDQEERLDSFTAAIINGFRNHPFPSLEQIQTLLVECERIVQEVELAAVS